LGCHSAGQSSRVSRVSRSRFSRVFRGVSRARYSRVKTSRVGWIGASRSSIYQAISNQGTPATVPREPWQALEGSHPAWHRTGTTSDRRRCRRRPGIGAVAIASAFTGQGIIRHRLATRRSHVRSFVYSFAHILSYRSSLQSETRITGEILVVE
jgi:hypothetical protein